MVNTSTARMDMVASSGTLKLNQMALDLEEHGKKVSKFTVGEPDFTTPDFIIDAAIKAMKRGETHYTSYKGILPLREEIAALYQQRGLDFRPDNVMVTPTKLGIYSAMMTEVEDDEEVLLPDPCWVSYIEMAKLSDGFGIYVSTEKDGKIYYDAETLQNAITPRTRMIVINTPSNPTGRVLTKDELKGIADLAEDYDIIVVADEVYEKLVYGGRKHISIATLGNMWERTITVSGFSKAYAMTGWRIGWVVAPSEVIRALWKFQQHTITCVPPFIQAAGLEALTNKEKANEHINNMKRKYLQRQKIMYNALKKIDFVTVGKPEGAFYLFPKINLNIDSRRLAERLMTEGLVAVTPGSAFGPHGEGYLRLSYATSKDTIIEGMDRFATTLEKISQEDGMLI